MQRTKLGMLKEAWSIARPYWFSEERWVARGLLAAVLAINLLQVWINVRLNPGATISTTRCRITTKPAFFYQLGLFAVLAGAYILLLVYGLYLQQMLQIRWRRWMTNVYLKEWLGDKTYYRLQLTGDGTDNPDQRIAEDLNQFPSQTLNLSLGLLTNIVQAVSFSFIFGTCPARSISPLGSWGAVSIPGYMFWAVLIYTGIATWLTIRLGRPLINLNFAQQRREADFRFSLVRLRENSESVAFYGGEARELDIFSDRFGKVFANFWAIMVRDPHPRLRPDGLEPGRRGVSVSGGGAALFHRADAARRDPAGRRRLSSAARLRSPTSSPPTPISPTGRRSCIGCRASATASTRFTPPWRRRSRSRSSAPAKAWRSPVSRSICPMAQHCGRG